ncbi:MAG: hypothetical protein ACI9F9_002134 [Candidatus Paceibacteria bacterium]|jgi:hypothetical protein
MPKVVRGPSSKHYLKMQWDYPVYAPGAAEQTEGTTSRAARRALTREEAVRYIAGDDPRPLLILRECKVCNGTDDALLKSGSDNEKTFLLSAWFHCVKLPVDVMEDDHPFHNIFEQKQPEHLFVCSIDGNNHNALESQSSKVELWDSMQDLLSAEYRKGPKASLKKLASLLGKLDQQDARLDLLLSRQEQVLEEQGPESKKLPKLASKIAKEEAALSKLHGDVSKAYRLQLKRQKEESKG